MSDRKFADWKWEGSCEIVNVEVRMRWGTERDIDAIQRDPPTFYIKTTSQLPLAVQSSDIAELAKLFVAECEMFFAITWAPKLVVHCALEADTYPEPIVKHGYGQGYATLSKTKLVIRVHSWDEGVRSDGKMFYRADRDVDTDRNVRERDPNNPIRKLDEWRTPARNILDEYARGHYDRDSTVALALIDDTPENRAALAQIDDGLRDLTAKLAAFLQPDKIEAALANGMKLLGS